MIDFYEDTARVNHEIVLYRWMRLIVKQFLAPIDIFRAWREYLNNNGRIMDPFILWLLITWITGNHNIRIDITRFRELELHVRVIGNARFIGQRVIKDTCEIHPNDRMVGATACQHA